MNWYYADAGKQAGPVSDEQLAELVRIHVITGETLVWREGMSNWAPYQSLGIKPPPAVPAGQPPAAAGASPQPFPGAPPASVFVTEQEILAREYKIEISETLSRSWGMFKSNPGIVIGTFIVFVLVLVGCSMLSKLADILIPHASAVLSLLYTMPLVAGLQWFFLRLANKEEGSLGDIFAGFRRNYLHLLLFGLVQMFYVAVCLLPLLVVAILSGLLAGLEHGTQSPENLATGLLLGLGVTFMLGLCAAMYLSTLFIFTALLIVDKGYSFWPAMRLSAKMVNRRWWLTFLFLVITGLVNIAGVLVCCVGAIVSAPVAWGMIAVLYNDNFQALAPRDESFT